MRHWLIGASCAILCLTPMSGAFAAPALSEADAIIATLAYGPDDILPDTDYRFSVTHITLPREKAATYFAGKRDSKELTRREVRQLRRYPQKTRQFSVHNGQVFLSKKLALQGHFDLDRWRLDEVHVSCRLLVNGKPYTGASNLKKGQDVLLRMTGPEETEQVPCLLLSFTKEG